MSKLIDRAELLTEVFGYWPTFHDAEVVRLVLNRSAVGTDCCGPSCEMLIHVFEMTDEITASGHYRLDKHHLIKLLFDGLDGIQLNGFNHQNAIFGLEIVRSDGSDDYPEPWLITINGSFGVEASFRCMSATVVSVIPCDSDGNSEHVA